MSEPRSGPVSLARYRPILYLFTGVAAAYAILFIHSNIISTSTLDGPLRRRNAVRRSRRTETDELGIADSPSYRAITHLEQLERQNGVYGTFRIETEDGRRVESGLLPSLLATRDQLMEEVGVPPAHAERMREMMEDTFLESFLALDFPSSHILVDDSAERTYLTEQLQRRGISRAGIERALIRFNADENYGDELRQRRQNGERVTLSTSTFPDATAPAVNPDSGETVVDDQSVFSWRDGNNDSSPTREGQNLLNLLYHIAEDQSRRDGYIHRGVTCNSCGAMPIQGIRYRCANCIDYDLCETCEAMQVHIKTHLFYKVRIPAPFLGNPRQSLPVWYPGKPALLPRSLPRPLAKRLMQETNFENTELDALWDQFRCLANYEWSDDPNKLHMAIDRKTFDRCFVPNTSVRPPPPSLIYDRMFSFYDTNGDNLIGFEEFLKGLASLNNKSNDERLRRVFRGYDIDSDGYVERKDFLRVFRAYYTLSRELTRDMVAGIEDEFIEGGVRDVVLGSQPLSSAFSGPVPSGETSRIGEGKRVNAEGDMEIVDNEGILRRDGADLGDRHSVVGDAAIRDQFGRTRSTLQLPTGESETRPSRPFRGDDADDDEDDDASGSDESSSSDASGLWPGADQLIEEDIVEALGQFVPPHEITSPFDRARIGTVLSNRLRDENQRRINDSRRNGIDERWRRRAFYTDEEDGATAPDGYQRDPAFDDISDEEDFLDELPPAEPQFRSRSSSKVRFQDDVIDDYDVRSNPSTSSRSVGERWGGFEIPEVEKDVGKEILYQVTQQGFNELLDVLFKQKEDLLMEAYRTRSERKIWAREIEIVQASTPQTTAKERDENELRARTTERSLDELLRRTGYALHNAPVSTGPVLAPPSPLFMNQDDDDNDDTALPAHLVNPENHEVFEQSHDQIFEDNSDITSNTGSSNSGDQPQIYEAASSHQSDDDDYDDDLDGNNDNDDEKPPHHDPTLPQFRPDEVTQRPRLSFCDDPVITAASSVSENNHSDLPDHLRLQPDLAISIPSLSSSQAEATAPKSPSPAQPLPSPRTKSAPLTEAATLPRRPSDRTLSRWAFLNQVELEAKERGGSGAKLNFEEFSRRMAADKERRLQFVASWIEMASF